MPPEDYEDDDIDEQEWLRAAANNPVFDFLNDPAEDIYTLDDGAPFEDDSADGRQVRDVDEDKNLH